MQYLVYYHTQFNCSNSTNHMWRHSAPLPTHNLRVTSCGGLALVRPSLDAWSRPLTEASSYVHGGEEGGGVRNTTASACLKVVLTEIKLGDAATPAQKAGTWLSHKTMEGLT